MAERDALLWTAADQPGPVNPLDAIPATKLREHLDRQTTPADTLAVPAVELTESIDHYARFLAAAPYAYIQY